jgi:hypothetical protein
MAGTVVAHRAGMRAECRWVAAGVASLLLCCGPVEISDPAQRVAGKADDSIEADFEVYAQADDPWGDDWLFGNRNCGTMAKKGCAVAALAILRRLLGDEVDPETQNQCMIDDGMHWGCGAAWEGSCTPGGRDYRWGQGRSWRRDLERYGPLIARVGKSDRDYSCAWDEDHFVVIESYDPDLRDYWILDPEGGTRARLRNRFRICDTRSYP